MTCLFIACCPTNLRDGLFTRDMRHIPLRPLVLLIPTHTVFQTVTNFMIIKMPEMSPSSGTKNP